MPPSFQQDNQSQLHSCEPTTPNKPGSVFNFISLQGLENLSNYKYVSGEYTFADNLMQPFWNWFVTLVPTSVAPNMITFIGMLFPLTAMTITLYFDPKLEGGLPDWIYLFSVISILVYQTFDAIDGKQARRTGTSGPLGQLFDHGCDAISTTVIMVLCFSCLKMGREDGLPSYFIILLLGHASFYMSQWEEHYSGVLNTSIAGVFGVTEIQWTQSIIMLVNVFGNGVVSDTKLFELFPDTQTFAPSLADKTLMSLAAYSTGALGACSALSSIYNVYTKVSLKRFTTEALSSLSIFVKWAICLVSVFRMTEWAWQSPGLVMVFIIPTFSLINCKMIICNVTGMEIESIDWTLALLILFPVNQLWFENYLPEWQVALLVFAVQASYFLVFVYCTVGQITQHLDIYCMTIKPRVAGKGKGDEDSSRISTEGSPKAESNQKGAQVEQVEDEGKQKLS